MVVNSMIAISITVIFAFLLAMLIWSYFMLSISDCIFKKHSFIKIFYQAAFTAIIAVLLIMITRICGVMF